jgi:hypothetical protein
MKGFKKETLHRHEGMVGKRAYFSLVSNGSFCVHKSNKRRKEKFQ